MVWSVSLCASLQRMFQLLKYISHQSLQFNRLQSPISHASGLLQLVFRVVSIPSRSLHVLLPKCSSINVLH